MANLKTLTPLAKAGMNARIQQYSLTGLIPGVRAQLRDQLNIIYDYRVKNAMARLVKQITVPNNGEITFTGLKDSIYCLIYLDARYVKFNIYDINFNTISSGDTNVALTVTATAISYTALSTDAYIRATVAGVTITLPTAVGIAGKVYNVKNASTGEIYATGTGGETLESATIVTLPSTNSYEFISNGTNWEVK